MHRIMQQVGYWSQLILILGLAPPTQETMQVNPSRKSKIIQAEVRPRAMYHHTLRGSRCPGTCFRCAG